MFDSAAGNIPAGAQVILLPSDGRYAAGNAAVKARFPAAAYQTYSAVGAVAAEWIDVEPGCVWPPAAAVALWARWRGNGVTRGFYCAKTTRAALAGLLAAGDRPEWFEADPSGTPHVLPGDTETQWGWFGGFDETEIAAAPVIVHGPPTQAVPAAPPAPSPQEGPMPEAILETIQFPDRAFALFAGGKVSGVLTSTAVAAFTAKGVPVLQVTAEDIKQIAAGYTSMPNT